VGGVLGGVLQFMVVGAVDVEGAAGHAFSSGAMVRRFYAADRNTHP
jgi:hypothetical protein